MGNMKENRHQVDHYHMFINGEWIPAASGKSVEVENPSNEEVIATVPAGDEADAQTALKAAETAQPAWAALPAIERGNILNNVADNVLAHRERLAKLLVQEQGKIYSLALGEVDVTADFIRFAAQAARRLEGDIYPSDLPNEHIWIHKVPFGVTVGLAAWNFPLALAGRKLGPALVAGNAMVVKPPTITPVTTLEFAQLAHEAGVPAGVLSVVTGTGSTMGKALVTNPITRLVTMTGSVGTGQQLYNLASENITAIRLELGGKAPFIVLEDANIEQAVEAAMVSRFLNCGQVCTCNERMYVHEAVYQEFMDQFIARASKLKIGDPMKADTDVGPKVSGVELEAMEMMVENAVKDGCKVKLGGKRPSGSLFEKGHWYEPTVLTEASNEMKIMQEEIFGPVIPVAKIRNFDEALTLANDSEFGLSAFLFTRDMKRIMRCVRELDFGEIYVNRPMGELRQGFHNGFKRSGTGGEDGKYGLENYLEKKTFYVNFS